MDYNFDALDGASLENASELRPELHLRPCNCNSVFCLKACKMRAYCKWVDKLKPAVAAFQSVMMLTLTIDPKRFDSPLHAWQTVGKRRWIAETVQKLARRRYLFSDRWFYVLEFQKNGWPHWHLAVDSEYIPHNVLQESWGYGFTAFSKSTKPETGDHAVYYLLKYMKKNERQPPEWAMRYEGRMRLIATSRGLVPTEKRTKSKQSKRKRKSKTIEQRTDGCGQATKLIAVVPIMGGVKYKFKASFNVPFEKRFASMSSEEREAWLREQRNKPIEVKPFDEFDDYSEKAA